MDPWTWVLLCGSTGTLIALLIAVLLLGRDNDELR